MSVFVANDSYFVVNRLSIQKLPYFCRRFSIFNGNKDVQGKDDRRKK